MLLVMYFGNNGWGLKHQMMFPSLPPSPKYDYLISSTWATSFPFFSFSLIIPVEECRHNFFLKHKKKKFFFCFKHNCHSVFLYKSCKFGLFTNSSLSFVDKTTYILKSTLSTVLWINQSDFHQNKRNIITAFVLDIHKKRKLL